jgi:hypothetical protein
MILSEMVQRVQRYLPGRQENDLFKELLNEKLESLALPFYFRELEVVDKMIGVEGGEFIRPPSFEVVDYVVDDIRERALDKKEIGWLLQKNPLDVGCPEVFIPFGSYIYIYPVPPEPAIYTIYGRRKPSKLVADTDEPEIPTDWHPIVCKLAASEALFIFGEKDRAMDIKNEALGDISTRQEHRTMDRRGVMGQMSIARR